MKGLEPFERKSLLTIFESNDILAVYLFGSRVDGTFTPASDYDFAVLLKEAPSFEEASLLMLEIQDNLSSILSGEVDVVVLNTATIEQRFLIISRGTVIYSGDDNIRTDFEDIAIRDYLDFKPFLDAYRRDVREAIKEGEFYA